MNKMETGNSAAVGASRFTEGLGIFLRELFQKTASRARKKG